MPGGAGRGHLLRPAIRPTRRCRRRGGRRPRIARRAPRCDPTARAARSRPPGRRRRARRRRSRCAARPAARSRRISMPDAFACLTAFVMLSATTKYDARLDGLGEALVRRPDDPDRQRARCRRATPSAAASPRWVRIAGCRPRASSRSSFIARSSSLRAPATSCFAAVGVAVELVLEHAQLDRERDEALLRAVVEVALQAAALVQPGLEDAQPRRVELLARLGALQRERDAAPRSRRAGARRPGRACRARSTRPARAPTCARRPRPAPRRPSRSRSGASLAAAWPRTPR